MVTWAAGSKRRLEAAQGHTEAQIRACVSGSHRDAESLPRSWFWLAPGGTAQSWLVWTVKTSGRHAAWFKPSWALSEPGAKATGGPRRRRSPFSQVSPFCSGPHPRHSPGKGLADWRKRRGCQVAARANTFWWQTRHTDTEAQSRARVPVSLKSTLTRGNGCHEPFSFWHRGCDTLLSSPHLRNECNPYLCILRVSRGISIRKKNPQKGNRI